MQATWSTARERAARSPRSSPMTVSNWASTPADVVPDEPWRAALYTRRPWTASSPSTPSCAWPNRRASRRRRGRCACRARWSPRASSSSRSSSARRCSTATRAACACRELGQAFLRDCSELVGRTNEVVDQMREVTASPAGRLRVHALPGFVLGHLARLLQEFQARYPQIVLDLIVSDAVIDPVREGFDCALQIFPPHSEELISRKLFPVRRVFCASPDLPAALRHAAPAAATCWATASAGIRATRRASAWCSTAPREPVALELKPVLLTQQRAPAARIRARACRHRLPAHAGGRRRRCWPGELVLVLPEYPLSALLAVGVLPDAACAAR